MYDFIKDIQVNLVLPSVNVQSNRAAFQIIADKTAPLCGLPPEDILERLLDHEAMASSGVGAGVSIPHMKFRRINKPFTVLARLNKTVEFKAVDGEPVDLICMVMSPMTDGPLHLRRLARITRLLRNEDLCLRLREAKEEKEMMDLIMEPQTWMMAA